MTREDPVGPGRPLSFAPETVQSAFLEERTNRTPEGSFWSSAASPLSGPELNLDSFGVNQNASYGPNKDLHCEPLQKQLTWLLPDLEFTPAPPL